MKRRDFLAAGIALPLTLRGASLDVASTDRSSTPLRSDRPVSPRARDVHEPFADLIQLVEARMREHGIPGAALGVIKDGQLQMRGLGVTSIEDPRPVTDGTIFELASLSKTVTAHAVMALVQQGKLDLDAPVRRYIPSFRVQDEAASAAITTRHLLSHTAGFEPRYSVGEGEGALGRWIGTTGDLIQLSPPGRVWSYSNPGFGVAGRLVEVATGRDFRDALEELVFTPLGLDRATAHVTEVMTWPVALGHRPGRGGGAAEVVRPYSMGSSIPAGGVNMSLASLMKYIAFHLGEHDGTGAGALSRDLRAAMRQPQLRKDPTGEEMGIGFHLRTLGGVRTAAHGGTAGAGHRCHLQIVPDRRLGFAILTNHTEGWRLLQVVERAALQAYEGLALTPNQPICGYRGHTETLDHVTALVTQPSPAPYIGRYRRGQGNPTEVRAAPGGGLLVGGGSDPVLFYGTDVAFQSVGDRINHEFIRDGGQVRWMRVGGQIARKEP
jgi:CubicO group peptidase (beta-lactamase class C family)